MRTCLILAFALLIPASPQPSDWLRFYIWNVGQGQWTTLTAGNYCFHFDMGGEFAPWALIGRVCAHKKNQVAITHWDRDHFNFLFQFSQRFPSSPLCLIVDHSNTMTKQHRLWPVCKNLKSFRKLVKRHSPPKSYSIKSSNDQSVWYVLLNDILITGDANCTQEKVMASRSLPLTITSIVVGHHGSSDSNCLPFLKHFPNLRNAWVSARKIRYGHPHPKTIHRLKSLGVHAHTTEKKGSMVYTLPVQKMSIE